MELERTTPTRKSPTLAVKFDAFNDVEKSAVRKCEEKSSGFEF